MSREREYEFLVRFVLSADELQREYDQVFDEEPTGNDDGVVLDPKQQMCDLIQTALYDGDAAISLPGLFRVIEVRRAPVSIEPMFRSVRPAMRDLVDALDEEEASS